jgi:hypothetical protein
MDTPKSLFEFDAIVVSMRNAFNASEIVAPTGLIEDKRFEVQKLLEKGGITVVLMDPEARWILPKSVGSYDWIPVPSLGNIVLKGEGQRIRRTIASPFDQYLDLPSIVWYAYLNESQRVKYETLAKNEGDFAIAARIDMGKGAIYLLPYCSNEGSLSVLSRCLERAWKKPSPQRAPPPWLDSISVPQQAEMLQELNTINSKIEGLVEQGRKLSGALENKLEVMKLLYEQGTSLEDAVRSAFEELGFKLEREGDRDLVFGSPDEKVILEVTGSVEAIDLAKIRQLLEFLLDEEKKLGHTPKGILVGNYQIDTPPSERGIPFTQAVVDRAKTFGICLLPSQELFQVIILLRQGKLDAKQFWKDLIGTTGTFSYQPSTRRML